MKPIAAMWNSVAGPQTIVVGASAHTINTNAGAKVVAITGKAGSNLVAVCFSTNTLPQPPTDDKGGSWIQAVNTASSAGVRHLRIFVRQSGGLADASTVTVTMTPTSGDTGGGIAVFRLDNADETAPGYAYLDNNGLISDPATGVPYLPFSAGACLATNCQIGCVISTNISPAAPTGWTLYTSGSYATPTLFWSIFYRQSGETGTTISCGAASATAWCSSCVEFKPLGV
jgi:hypothetical protein